MKDEELDPLSLGLPTDGSEEINRRFSERKINDFRVVSGTKEGMRFLWELLEDCGVFRVSYSGGANDTFYREGRRSIGLGILAYISQANPQLYVRMQQEMKRFREEEKSAEENIRKAEAERKREQP